MRLLLSITAICLASATVNAAAFRSPGVEVTLHLPPAFADIEAFKAFLGIRPERRRRHVRQKRETTDMEAPNENNPGANEEPSRMKRDDVPESTVIGSEPILVQSSNDYPVAMPLAQNPDQRFQQMDDNLEPDDPRKRRNTSANDHEDKRPYPDTGINQAGSTSAPFWKHKKSNPPFVTAGREGRQDFEQTRRTNENVRESHSMKDGKSISSNEIPRMTDSYYASSNDRSAFSRSAPKSVYDTIDYTNRPVQSRNLDPRARLATDPYDRNYYYQMGGEFANRGVEYYHRSVDPNNGRIIYYANLPEPDAYRASRSYAAYDAFGRSFPPVNNYPYYNNNYNPYWNSYQQYPMPDYSRSFRYQPSIPSQQLRSERLDRDDPRNKTYVIFDAEEKRFGTNYANRPVDDRYRPYTPPLPYPSFSPLSYNTNPYPSPYPSNYNAYSNINQDRRSLVRQVELPLTSRSSLKSTTS